MAQLLDALSLSVVEEVKQLSCSPENAVAAVNAALAGLPLFPELLRALTDVCQGPCTQDAEEAASQLIVALDCQRRGAFLDAVHAASTALRHTQGGVTTTDAVEALAVRAESLLRLGLPKEAVDDAELVLQLRPDLERAKKVVQQAQQEDMFAEKSAMHAMQPCDVPIYMPPELDHLQTLSHASSAVHIAIAGPAGRGLFTRGTLEPGDVIVCEPPACVVVHKTARTSRCHTCFRPLPLNYMPCSGCSFARYCSRNCMRQAYGPHGAYECRGSAWAAALPTECVLAARVALAIQNARPFGQGEHLASLQSHWPHDVRQRLEMCVHAVVLARCLANTSKEAPTPAMLLRALRLVRTNCFAVTDEWAPQCHSGGARGACTVAAAVYSTASLVNHSCSPVSHASFGMGGTVIIRATSSIPSPGCEITIAYGPQQGQEPTSMRMAHLRTSHAFVCTCKACADPDAALRDAQLTGLKCIVTSNCDGAVPVSQARGQQRKPTLCMRCGAEQPQDAIARAADAATRAVSDLSRVRDTLDVAAARRVLATLQEHAHARNRRVAEAWDVLAQALHEHAAEQGEASLREAQAACEAGIAILRCHYPSGGSVEPVAVAHELAKLAGLALVAGDKHTATRAAAAAVASFEAHYGASYPLAHELRHLSLN